jgi:hypothetical protein
VRIHGICPKHFLQQHPAQLEDAVKGHSSTTSSKYLEHLP